MGQIKGSMTTEGGWSVTGFRAGWSLGAKYGQRGVDGVITTWPTVAIRLAGLYWATQSARASWATGVRPE